MGEIRKRNMDTVSKMWENIQNNKESLNRGFIYKDIMP